MNIPFGEVFGKGSDDILGIRKIYCDKVNEAVNIQFSFDKKENGIYRTKKALNKQEFNCTRLMSPEFCMLCTPMTKYDIWQKLIKDFME